MRHGDLQEVDTSWQAFGDEVGIIPDLEGYHGSDAVQGFPQTMEHLHLGALRIDFDHIGLRLGFLEKLVQSDSPHFEWRGFHGWCRLMNPPLPDRVESRMDRAGLAMSLGSVAVLYERWGGVKSAVADRSERGRYH